MNHDKQIWSYFHSHWRAWFPRLGARSTFAVDVKEVVA